MTKNKQIYKIFKDTKEKYIDCSFVSSCYRCKHSYLIDGLSSGKNLSEIATEIGVSRQTIHNRFISLCSEIEKIEPRVTLLYTDFDTYLDLTIIITKKWLFFIEKLIIFRQKNIISTPLKKHFLIDSSFKHYYLNVNSYPVLTGDFISYLKKELPMSVKELAAYYQVNSTKLQYLLNTLFGYRIFILDGYIVSFEERAFVKALVNFCSSEKIAFSGTLFDVYSLFYKYYPNRMKKRKIYDYNDFIQYIQRRYNLFSSAILRRCDTKEYELKRYMNLHKICVFKHHNSK